VIVVLANSLALNDAADCIGWFLLEQALDTTHKTDFVALAQQSRDAYVQSFVDAEIQLEGGKDPQQDVKSVNAYTGDYFNALQNFYIRVFDQDDALHMCFHGQAWDVYPLQPYAADTFTWYTSREDQAKRGRWPIQAGDYFKLTFTSDADGKITQLQVNMDGLAAAEQTFHKKPPGSGKDEEAESVPHDSTYDSRLTVVK
jgi:hypothetical protein